MDPKGEIRKHLCWHSPFGNMYDIFSWGTKEMF
jgi:hypothetical protein